MKEKGWDPQNKGKKGCIVPLDVRIRMQKQMVFIFIEYCHRRCSFKLNADVYGYKPLKVR